MKGLTDYIFRNTFAAHFSGIDLAVAPFIASKRDNKFKRKYVKDVLPENNPLMPVIPQILSKSSKDFLCLANFLSDLGHKTVNWNLGCPFPMVARKTRGSGMLPHTDRIQAFLDSVVPAMNGKLSIKLRLGWETKDDIYRLIPILNQYPLEEVIIHPRTGIQRYEGEVDHEAFGKCLALLNHCVVYNGDIRTAGIFKALCHRFEHVKGWMIGRWCLINPFLPEIIKSGKDDVQNRTLRMRQFHDALFKGYGDILDGPSHLLNKMKGFWQYFSLSINDHRKSIKQIKKSRDPDQYMACVNRFFDGEVQWL